MAAVNIEAGGRFLRKKVVFSCAEFCVSVSTVRQMYEFGYLFQAGKDTVHSSGYPRSPPVISANFACANDKRYTVI